MTTTPDDAAAEEPDEELDTESVHVQTYIPAYQRDIWDEEAEEMNMNRSEYLRSMVQAGRRAMSGEIALDEDTDKDDDADLRDDVLEAIRDSDHVSFDVLVNALASDFEGRMDAILDELQNDDLIRYNGRHGGYTAVKEDLPED